MVGVLGVLGVLRLMVGMMVGMIVDGWCDWCAWGVEGDGVTVNPELIRFRLINHRLRSTQFLYCAW